MRVLSSSILLNSIPLCALWVPPPALRFRTHTNYSLHPFGYGLGFFPQTYKIIPFDIFQKMCFGTGNRSASVKTQSDPQNYSLPYTSSLFPGLTGHHILDWRLHTSYSPQIPVILKPTASNTRRQYSIFPHQITHVTLVLSDIHSIISLPEPLSPQITLL